MHTTPKKKHNRDKKGASINHQIPLKKNDFEQQNKKKK